MGGSGGGYFSKRVSADELIQRTREAEQRAHDEVFESEVNECLGSLLAEFNSRDVEGTQELLEQVKMDLENEVSGTVDTLFGGSVAKHTYLEGISDVDALVLLNNTELAGRTPTEVKEFLASCLRDRYGRDSVDVGALAVTITLSNRTVQLVPAVAAGSEFKIASVDGDKWSKISPREFAESLTSANRQFGDKLVPCIKLIKGIVAVLPRKRQITGYHAEAMAIKVFAGYEGERTYRSMVRYFFERAAAYVGTPIEDSSGQSRHVDEYLGEANSLSRRIVADAFGRIGRKMRNADGAKSVRQWLDLFE